MTPASGPRKVGRAAAFHDGERAIQRAAGVMERADQVAGIVDDRVELMAQAFLASVSCVALGAADRDGQVWASLLFGPPTFVRASPGSVRITMLPTADDPIGPHDPGDHIGLIAMDFAHRRRLRVNGRVLTWGPRLIEISVDQTYGNCSRYIQRRSLDVSGPIGGGRTSVHSILAEKHQELIARSDTLFIATRHPMAGADASHRGGPPGFLRVVGPNQVQLPDYAGNSMFNTLGNLSVDPHVGLVLCDFETGDTLQLTGRATIDHEPQSDVWTDDVQRVTDIRVHRLMWTWGRRRERPF